jgi:hypothetical protein
MGKAHISIITKIQRLITLILVGDQAWEALFPVLPEVSPPQETSSEMFQFPVVKVKTSISRSVE